MKNHSLSKTIALSLGVLVMSLLVSFIVLAWTGPSSPPPEGNVPAPLDSRSSDLDLSGATWTERNIRNINILSGYNDLFLRGDASETAPVYIAGSELKFYTGGIERMEIGSSGNVVIGNGLSASSITLGGVKRTTWPSGGVGDITAVSAGTGLFGGGTSGNVTLRANTTYLQRRVSGTCATGSSIRVINADGTVSCQTDTSGSSLWTQSGSNIYYNAGSIGVGTTPSSSYKIYSKGGSYGIRAEGSTMGGYFRDSDGTSFSYVAYGGWGILGYGDSAGGYFSNLQGTSGIYLAYSDYGIYQSIGSKNYFKGNVGIGTTNPTTAKLVVSGANPAIDAGLGRIINVASPTASSDVATKGYVDAAGDNAYSAAFVMPPTLRLQINQGRYLCNRSAPSCPSGWIQVTTFPYVLYTEEPHSYIHHLECPASLCALPR